MKEPIDLVSKQVSSLVTISQIELFTFVKAAGHENIFFVLEQKTGTENFLCIEVHPIKEEAYRQVILHKKQLSPAQWQGEFMTLMEAKIISEEKSRLELEQEIIPLEFRDLPHNKDPRTE